MDAADQTIPFEPEIDEDWEEWDGRSPFWIHCVAGSMAGVTEVSPFMVSKHLFRLEISQKDSFLLPQHTLVYPLDTVRTHIQVCASCIHNTKNAAKSAASSSAKPMMKDAALLRSALRTQPQLPTGVWQTIRHLVNEPIAMETTASVERTAGLARLWRGVQTMFIGCIPAHALYFSSYEFVKAQSPNQEEITPLISSLAGAAATNA